MDGRCALWNECIQPQEIHLAEAITGIRAACGQHGAAGLLAAGVPGVSDEMAGNHTSPAASNKPKQRPP